MAGLVIAAPAKPDLSRRSRDGEWLDGELDPAILADVLRDLARFNGLMLGHWPVLAWLARAARSVPEGESLTVLDAGCGYGDLLRAIRHWADRRELALRLIGIDLNAETVRVAKAASALADDIEYHVGDIFSFRPAQPVDIVVSSLLTHHLSDDLIVKFLRWMEMTARRGWFIYDLQRHAMPYWFIGAVGKLLRLHPIVIHDGQVSVARSLTRSEWRARFAEAGLAAGDVDLRWFMYRFAIGRLR